MRIQTLLTVTEPGKRPVWRSSITLQVASRTQPAVVWTCTRLADGSWICNCPDFTYRNLPCWHIGRARVMCGDVVTIDPGDLL